MILSKSSALLLSTSSSSSCSSASSRLLSSAVARAGGAYTGSFVGFSQRRAEPRHTAYSAGPSVLVRSHTYSSQVHLRSRMGAGSSSDDKVVVNDGKDDTSLKGKLKAMWANYGAVAIGTYLGIYVSVLSSVYFALDYDVFNAATFGFDPVAAVKKVCDLVEYGTGNNFLPGYIREHPKVGTFAIAWVMTKFTEPVRLAVAISIVPSVARFLKFAPQSPSAQDKSK